MPHRTPTASTAVILGLLLAAGAGGTEPPNFVPRAAELMGAGDSDGAREVLDAVTGSERPWADHYLGRIALDRGELDSAIDLLETAAKAEPEISVFQRWLGEAYIAKISTVSPIVKLRLAKKAIAALQRAVELAPADLGARDSLVGFYLNAPPIAGGSKRKAAEQVAELKQIDPAEGNILQGQLHLRDEEWSAAETAFRAALEADKDNARYLYLVGFSQQQQERYDQAIATFQQAIELDPDTVNAYYQIGRTAVLAGTHLELGVEHLEAYLERPAQRGAPAHQHAWWRLGMLRKLQDDEAGAREAYRQALAIDPEHAEARKALAKLDD